MSESESSDFIEFPITDSIDLHTFHPSDVKELVPEYLEQCRLQGIFFVRIIHGKGTGSLRRTVESILRRNPSVHSFGPAQDSSGHGATLVQLLSLE